MDLAALWVTRIPVYERVAFVLYLVVIFSLAPTNWNGYADLRAFVEVYLLAVLILLGTPLGRKWTAVLAALSGFAAPMVITVALYRTQIW